MPYYTFSTLGKDGKRYYPKWMGDGDQSDMITCWTEESGEAIMWKNPEHFDCLMNEYENTRIEVFDERWDIPKLPKYIKITNANNKEKFISFKIDGLEDGITVGLYPNGDGLVVTYKGDQTGVPFNADSDLIAELNSGEI